MNIQRMFNGRNVISRGLGTLERGKRGRNKGKPFLSLSQKEFNEIGVEIIGEFDWPSLIILKPVPSPSENEYLIWSIIKEQKEIK